MNATTSPSRKRWLWLAIALALVLLVVFWAFIKQPAAPAPDAAAAGPKPSLTVTVAQPERSSLPIRLQANGNITGDVLSLKPTVSPNGDVIWNCGYKAVEGAEAATGDSGDNLTDIEPKYLPQACRDTAAA